MTIFVFRTHLQNGAQLALGIEAHNRRHDLGWHVVRLVKNDNWRIGDYLDRHADESCAVAGLLHDQMIASFGQWRDRLTILSATSGCRDPRAWVVQVDDASIGRQAVDHFHQAGFRALATWGHWDVSPRAARFASAEERCRALGLPLYRLAIPHDYAEEAEGDTYILKHLHELPKPLGIITHQDSDAAFLRSFCLSNDVAIPSEVGILGVDNDSSLCMTMTPELSSVQVPWFQIGKQMAQIWQRIVSGGEAPERRTTVAAYGVHARASTDLQVHQVSDELVKRFLSKARRAALRGQGVGELVSSLGVSQPTLYRRVRAALGKKPQEVILDLRVAKACSLLLETDLTLAQVAKQSGFSRHQHLHDAFVARYPVAPGLWRQG